MKSKSFLSEFYLHRTIYEKLSSAFVDEIKEIYDQRVQELVPNIRYCAYNIGDESAMEDLRQMRIKTGGKEDALSSRLDVRFLLLLSNNNKLHLQSSVIPRLQNPEHVARCDFIAT